MKETESSTTIFRRIWDQLIRSRTTELAGLPGLSLRTHILTHLCAAYPHPNTAFGFLWLTDTAKERDRIVMLLEYWKKITPHTYTVLSADTSMSWVIATINQTNTILVATQNDFLLQTKLLPHTTTSFRITDKTAPQKIRKLLLDLNFLELPDCKETNAFTIKGSTVQILPFGYSLPITITFDFDAISSISIGTGKNSKKLTQFHLPLLAENEEPADAWLSVWDGVIYDTTLPIQPFLKKKFPKKSLVLSTFAVDDKRVFDFATTLLPDKTSKKFLEKITNTPITTILCPATLKHTFTATKTIHTTPFVYMEQWYSPVLKTINLTPQQTAQKKQKKHHTHISKNIHVGDYVVHQDHGIGRFTGMTTQTIDGVTKEYLLLTYAGGDKLYVPPYQIQKISKYIGEAHPEIHKLSGSTWLTTVKKIKEEALLIAHDILQLSAKRQLIHIRPIEPVAHEQTLWDDFEYKLTPDQEVAWQAIANDLESGQPMDRLLCGDVGFGKTEIALRTAFRVAAHGNQVALLAPTTILVQQHYDTFVRRLAGTGIKVGLLSRWQTKAEQLKTITELASGDVQIIIGTHRLLSKDVHFNNIALLIIDEEQKFGVKAKDTLRSLRPSLHTLALSATPIPRTLHYSLSGLREISLIQTPPPGRLPVTTAVIPHNNDKIREAILSEIARGGQVYYLMRKVQEIPAKIQQLKKLLPTINIGVAHGALPPKELAYVMKEFDHGHIQVLLASTIIENGLDVANANTLIVDNAAHFGLSQLYQLRGRIGRSTTQGFAYLFFQKQKLTGIAAKRLQALQSAYELGAGFDVALRDLEIRGAGNLLGKEQHGQINAVGVGLYTQLLEEALEMEKTKAETKEFTTQIDTRIDLPIPNALTDVGAFTIEEKLRIYQALAWATDVDELKAQADTLLPPPRNQTAHNIVKLAELKRYCQILGIYEVMATVRKQQPLAATINFHFSPTAKKIGIRALLSTNDGWKYDGSTMKIRTEDLGESWLDIITNYCEQAVKNN